MSRSVFFARTMRCATVGSLCRKARAISSVDSPPRQRRVSATRDSRLSTGWHAVTISRSTSSPMWSSSASSTASPPARSAGSSSRPRVRTERSCTVRRRCESTARFLAVVISQPAGFGGTPVRGHCSSAATRASCAYSSASPTSRVTLARPAMSRPDSMRQMASTSRRAWGSRGASVMARSKHGSRPRQRRTLLGAGSEVRPRPIRYCRMVVAQAGGAKSSGPKILTTSDSPVQPGHRSWCSRMNREAHSTASSFDRTS